MRPSAAAPARPFDTGAGTGPDREQALHTYRLMLNSRLLDEFLEDQIARGVPVPHFHSGTGQEALTVGAATALQADDKLLYTHRGYGQLLARGIPLVKIVADMLGRTSGTNGGFGGVLHVSAPECGVPGREGVFGTRFTIGAGLALAARLEGADRVVLCFYGEAAGSRGPLYEALNLAVLWHLPLVLVAENNGYSISSRTDQLYPGGRMSAVWRGFGIPVREVDGNDAEAVWMTVADAARHARAGQGPTVVEGITYRVPPHIPGDVDTSYREAWQVEKWRRRDPVELYAAVLRDRGWLTSEDQQQLAVDLREQVVSAWDVACSAPTPSTSDLAGRRRLL